MDINKLIKLAKSYDTVGLYHEADKIMIKLAQNQPLKPFGDFKRAAVKVKYGDKESFILPPAKYIGPESTTKIEYRRYNYFQDLIYKYLSDGEIGKLRNTWNEINKYNLNATVDGTHNARALRVFLAEFFQRHDIEKKDNEGEIYFYKLSQMPSDLNQATFAINGESLWLSNIVNKDSLANVIKVGSQNKATLDPSSISLEGISPDQFDTYSKLLYDDEKNQTNNFISAINKDFPEFELIKNGNNYIFKLRDKLPGTSAPTSAPTPKPGFTLGDVFKAAGSNYAMDPNVSKTVIPNQERYNTLLAKIKSATTPQGFNDLKLNLATYGLSVTSDNGLYAIKTNTPESEASQAQPLAAPKNTVQMAHPIADVNVQQYNLLRQKRQETNQDALRSEWNGYIESDSFLQSLESRLKDIHNQVNPTNKSDVFNEGMIATIESKRSEYKPLIDMYRARKAKTYQNVGDLGPAQMYGTK